MSLWNPAENLLQPDADFSQLCTLVNDVRLKKMKKFKVL